MQAESELSRGLGIPTCRAGWYFAGRWFEAVGLRASK